MKISDQKKKKKQKTTTTTDVKSTPTGVAKWIQEYRDRFSIDLDQLEQNALDFLDGKQRSQNNDLTDKSAPDNNADQDDSGGWTVVSHSLKKTRQRMVASTDKTLNRLRAQHKRSSEAKELTNFYKFQMTDKKVDQLEQLKLKFELDKQRIAQMRQQRKFKPF